MPEQCSAVSYAEEVEASSVFFVVIYVLSELESSLSSKGDSNSGQSLIQMRDSDSNSTHLSWVHKITLWTLHDTVVHQLQYAEIISLRLFHKLFLVYVDATTGPRNVQVPAALPTFARFTDVLNSAQTGGVDGGLRDEVGAGLRCGRVGV